MFDSWRFLDVRPRGGLRTTWGCSGRGLPLRLYRGKGWGHHQSLLRRRGFKHRPGTRQHSRSVDMAGCAWSFQRSSGPPTAAELEAQLDVTHSIEARTSRYRAAKDWDGPNVQGNLSGVNSAHFYHVLSHQVPFGAHTAAHTKQLNRL